MTEKKKYNDCFISLELKNAVEIIGLDSKHVLKVYFKPRKKNPEFGFLPVPILPVSVKIGHLNNGLESTVYLAAKLLPML